MASKMTLPPAGLAEDILTEIRDEPDEMQIVTFSLGEHYGIPISQVQEIIRVGNITMVPNSPPYMEGVINLRGRVLPVLNLRKRLMLPGKSVTKESRIVVTEVNSRTIGLLVDAVAHVMKVSSGLIEVAPEEVLEVNSDYITGVCTLPNSLVILVNLEKLLRRENVDTVEGQETGAPGRGK